MILFVEQIITRRDLGFLVLMAEFELRDDLVGGVVFVGCFVRSARNDKRRTGLVDQDRVDLVDDREIMITLYERLDVELHIIPEIIEAEFVVRSVCDVACICVLSLYIVHIVLNTADREAEEGVNFAHPLGIARSEIVIDRDDIYTAARKAG